MFINNQESNMILKIFGVMIVGERERERETGANRAQGLSRGHIGA